MNVVKAIVAGLDTALMQRLRWMLHAHDGMELAGTATSLHETFGLVETITPQIVLIDARLTGTEEFVVMRRVFETIDLRWLVYGTPDAQPQGGAGIFELGTDFSSKQVVQAIRSLCNVPRTSAHPAPHGPKLSRTDKILLIGASTGGVDALSQMLSQFPADCPPTVVVQHTRKTLGHDLAALLNRRTRAQVTVAAEGHPLCRGVVQIAAGLEGHAELSNDPVPRLRITKDGPTGMHMPSVDQLFYSAVSLANRTVAALLTGMGRDGAQGLLALRRAGARTFAQDKASSVVYGMPQAAAELGAADQILALNRMPSALLHACGATQATEETPK